MKRILLLATMLIVANFSYAQFTTTSGITSTTDKVRIGTGDTPASLTVNSTSSSNSATGYNTIADFRNTIYMDRARLAIGNGYPGAGASSALLFYGYNAGNTALEGKWEVGTDLFGIHGRDLYFFNNNLLTTQLFLHGNGNVGIMDPNPVATFQVDGGQSKACIGDASGADLKYGTSYLGFNAGRSGTNWMISGDNVHNGGGVIYSTIEGEMLFAPIGSTAGTDKTLTDANIASAINFKITPTGAFAKKLTVTIAPGIWPDFVFKPAYHLRSLSEVKTYIDQHQHLPDVPAAATVEKEGLDVAEMNKILLKKVEELTLYLLELKEENQQIKDKLKKHHIN